MELASASLPELFDQYEEELELLREMLPSERRQSVDNLYLLRYVISYGGVHQSTVDAVVKGIEWRANHASLVEGARNCCDEVDSSPLAEYIASNHLQVLDACLKAAFAGTTECPAGFPVYLIQSGQSALADLMRQVPSEAVSLWLTWRNEIGYWRCDSASREKCCLVKQLVLLNLSGCRLTDQDPRFFVAYARSSKRSEYLHPQLLARQVVVNPPAFMSYFWALGRRLLSERLLKKVHVVRRGGASEHLSTYFPTGGTPPHLLQAIEAASATTTSDAPGGTAALSADAASNQAPSQGSSEAQQEQLLLPEASAADFEAGAEARAGAAVADSALLEGSESLEASRLEAAETAAALWVESASSVDVPLPQELLQAAGDGETRGSPERDEGAALPGLAHCDGVTSSPDAALPASAEGLGSGQVPDPGTGLQAGNGAALPGLQDGAGAVDSPAALPVNEEVPGSRQEPGDLPAHDPA